jgi:WD40 repeat protein
MRALASPAGDVVAGYSMTNVVTTYDARDGHVLATYDTDGDSPANVQHWFMTPLAFSPDGATLAVGSGAYVRGSLRLLDPRTLTPSDVQLGHQTGAAAKIVAIAYSASGRYLAVSSEHSGGTPRPGYHGTDDSTSADARVWDLAHPARKPVVIALDGLWDDIALSPDGRTVYASSPLTAYAVASGERLWRRDDLVSFHGLGVTPDGRTLGFDATVNGGHKAPIGGYLVDAATGRTLLTLRKRFVQFSDDGRRLLATRMPDVFLVDVPSGVVVRRATTGDLTDVALGADGASLLLADGPVIRTWDLTGRHTLVERERQAPASSGAEVRFSPDGRYVALDAQYSSLQLFDRRTGVASDGTTLTFGAGDDFRNGQWSADGGRYYYAGADDVVRALDPTGRVIATWAPPEPGLSGSALSADGSTLAVTFGDDRLVVLDPVTLRPRGDQLTLAQRSCCLTMSPDGKQAFVLTRTNDLRPGENNTRTGWAFVDLGRGTTIRTGGAGAPVTLASWSPDGSRIAIAGGRWVQVLDATTGRPVGPARTEHDDLVAALSWSPDGHTLLSGAYDSAVVFWSGRDGHLLARVKVSTTGGAMYPAYLSDGTLLIGSEFGQIYRFNPSLARAEQLACHIAGRDLTRDEWQQAFGAIPQRAVCPS